MPLSEHEQRMLEQLERALYAEDPKFASTLRGASPRAHARRRVLKASIGFVAGIALLLTGVITTIWPVGIVGFLLMLASAFFALTSMRQAPAATDLTVAGSGGLGSGLRGKRSAKSRSGMMERFEERWNRRREGNGR